MKLALFISVVVAASLQSAYADSDGSLPFIRWTGAEDSNAQIAHVLSVVSQKAGYSFTAIDFKLLEDRPLAFNRYQRYEQVVDGVPVDGKAIRMWTDLKTGAVIQVEAALTMPSSPMKMARFSFNFGPKQTEAQAIEIARAEVLKDSNDPFIRGIVSKESFVKGELSRVITFTGKHGKRKVVVSQISGKVTSSEYREFPDADMVSLPAQVYSVYEEVESTGEMLPRETAMLKHVFKRIERTNADIYAPLRKQRYFDTNYAPVLGTTEEGRASGAWAMSYIKEQAAKIRATLPIVKNKFKNGLLLQGKYATINIHPDAFTAFKGIDFKPVSSTALFPNWIDTEVDGKPVSEMIPQTAYFGKPAYSADEIFNRVARRLPNNDAATYMNDGFDEIQVYYAITTLMEELQARGFKDPDLSTRPFNAFLFNPDIAYRDNAFYTDDTINFTTYSDKTPNMARDNSTIWHELGHGVMDRLMGDDITLADTGGLSEGMADFVAAMVIQAVKAGKPFPGSQEFRIINKTGFFLTNEVHDDGESYGGAMKDFLDAAVAKYGQAGLAKVTDVILEAMRLCRDNPALTAKDWFDHIVFADSLGRPGVRAPGEMKSILMAAVNGRNYRLDGGQVAKFTLTNVTDNQEVVAGGAGSRSRPIRLNLAKDAQAHFDISAALASSDEYKFEYPVTVKVSYNNGPLQGAVHWIGEEKGPTLVTLNSEADVAKVGLDVSGTCDQVNRQDGSCVDFVYVQILNRGENDHPHAKKRFYVQVKNP